LKIKYLDRHVLGSRPASYLVYNFNSSIGLDWSGDWSIYVMEETGWYTYDGFMVAIESLVQTRILLVGYIWWGNNGANTIAQISITFV
jgi:hypothetical protein